MVSTYVFAAVPNNDHTHVVPPQHKMQHKQGIVIKHNWHHNTQGRGVTAQQYQGWQRNVSLNNSQFYGTVIKV